MTNIENIHNHIEKLVIKSPEIAALIARYKDIYRSDKRTTTTLLQTLAEQDSFFIGFDLDEFKQALDTYEMPLTK